MPLSKKLERELQKKHKHEMKRTKAKQRKREIATVHMVEEFLNNPQNNDQRRDSLPRTDTPH